MAIDWHLVADVAVPIGTAFRGGWVQRWFENKPRLASYYGHVGAFKHTLPDGSKLSVFTHSLVLRNNGRKTATNGRIRHNTLPADFDIYPSVPYSIVELPSGGRELVIPTMVPGQQITVNYLYFPPLTVDQVHDGILSDEGFAEAIPVLLQRQYSRWVTRLSAVLVFTGFGTLVYFFVQLIRWLISLRG